MNIKTLQKHYVKALKLKHTCKLLHSLCGLISAVLCTLCHISKNPKYMLLLYEIVSVNYIQNKRIQREWYKYC
jgi:hypothetical protein